MRRHYGMISVTKSKVCFTPDSTRVLAKPFLHGAPVSIDGNERVRRIVARVLSLPESRVVKTLASTEAHFEGRHRHLRQAFEANYATVVTFVPQEAQLSLERRLLIGAYFTHEYAVEAAALSNPSMVAAPNQGGLRSGETRFIMSLRAIGEGHISSIQFRSGVVGADGTIAVDTTTRFLATAEHRAPIYEKHLFHDKLVELRALSDIAAAVLERLSERFTLEELEAAISAVNQQRGEQLDAAHATRTLHWLASSNYESTFAMDSALPERILFPAGPTESHGMEDARFVRFTREDGSVTYYATYTAYDGYEVLPQLIQTADFRTFRIATLNGQCARNKGIALFPRKVNGKYAALGRLDNENNFLMWSDNVSFWHESQLLQVPERDWEITQLGNCGSPLETDAGWLVITHGVGPMRQYTIGAILLDKTDPARVIGHLREPLLRPSMDERDGYVPNVVYSCGSMLAGEYLVLPYGYSDVGTRIATVRLSDLLTELTAR